MPTPFSHPAAALALAPWFRPVARPSAVIVAVFLSLVPDLDIIGYRLGIPYESPFGHRGFTHSIAFAVVCALPAALLLARWLRVSPLVLWVYFSIGMISHGVLDACTSGGGGVAVFAPFDDTRYMFPWRGIRVAPLTLGGMLSARGWAVIQSELLWVWLPAVAVVVGGGLWSRRSR